MYLTNKIDTAKIERLVARHGTKFFDESLKPVVPRAGQWFQEFAVDTLFGSLDFATGEKVMELMFELNRETGTTLVLVTHDRGIAARCDRQLRIEAGRVDLGALAM